MMKRPLAERTLHKSWAEDLWSWQRRPANQRESVRQSIDKALLMPVIVGLAAPTVLTAPTTAAFATTATA
jgi:hypothetical protein